MKRVISLLLILVMACTLLTAVSVTTFASDSASDLLTLRVSSDADIVTVGVEDSITTYLIDDYSNPSLLSVEITYSKSDLLDYINGASKSDFQGILEKFLSTGILEDTINYSSLSSSDKAGVASVLYATKSESGFASLDALQTDFDSSFVASDDVLSTINNANTVSAMKTVLDKLVAANKWEDNGYSELNSHLRLEVAENFLEAKGSGFLLLEDAESAWLNAFVFDILEATISAKDYASVVMSTTTLGSNSGTPPATMTAYVNQSFSAGLQYANRIATFAVPCSSLVETITFDQCDTSAKELTNDNGSVNARIYFFGTFADFPFDYAAGTYDQDSLIRGEAYTKMASYVSSFRDLTATYGDFKLMAKYSSNASAKAPVTLTDNLDAFKESGSKYLTLHVSMKNRSKYVKYYIAGGVPGIEVTYKTGSVLNALSSASTASELKTIIDDLCFISNFDFSAYSVLSDEGKLSVCENLIADKENVFASWLSFVNGVQNESATQARVILNSAFAKAVEDGYLMINGTKYDSDHMIIMYGTVYGEPDSYGINLAQSSNLQGYLPLASDGSTDDGRFAIRAIGTGITAGSYTAWPYFTAGASTVQGSGKYTFLTTTEETPIVENVTISGDDVVGGTLTCNYDYDSTVSDASTIRWQRLANGEWEDISGATGKEYTLTSADDKSYIRAAVTATNANGDVWTDVYSDKLYIGEIAVFVSPTGDDATADGSIEKPYGTISTARDAMRELIGNGKINSTEAYVYFRGGDYKLSETVYFNASDSAPNGTRIIYKPYNNENVVIHGATQISSSKISKVTESDLDKYGNKLLSRITNETAKNNLYKIDLSEYTGEIPAIPDHGYSSTGTGFDSSWKPMEVYVNGSLLAESRWPNKGEMWKIPKSSSSSAAGTAIYYTDANNVTAGWNSQAIVDDLMVSGHTGSYWHSNVYKVASLDTTTKTFTTSYKTSGTATANRSMYFWNILEAIDQPMESFIDRTNKIAYFYSEQDPGTNADIKFTTESPGYLFSFSGTERVTLEGLNLMCSRSSLLNVSNVSDFVIRGCNVSHTSNKCASIDGTNITIENSIFENSGRGGITVSGGNATTLAANKIVIKNNYFADNAKVKHSYSPAINDSGVGTLITGNEITDNPHQLVQLSGYDTRISYNEIHHGCTEAGDMGAVYWGRQPWKLGYVLNNNYFHDNGSPYNGGGQSIFADDRAFGAEVYNNIFSKPTNGISGGTYWAYKGAIKANGAQYYNIYNNIFVDAYRSHVLQDADYTATKIINGVSTSVTVDEGGFINFGYFGTYGANDNPTWSTYILPKVTNQYWIDKYKDTNWESFWKMFSVEEYENGRALKDAVTATSQSTLGDAFDEDVYNANVDAFVEWMKNLAPVGSNKFTGNVNVNISNQTLTTNNYDADDTSIFKDYANGNFELTDEGLATVKANGAPDFKNISMAEIGPSGTVGTNYQSVVYE